MSLEIDGVAIPTPQEFHISNEPIRREQRLASGRLVIDYIATKKRFLMHYTDLTGVQLGDLIYRLTDEVFFEFTYPTETGSDTVTATVGDIPRRLWFNAKAKRYDTISIELVEQ